MRYLSFFAVLFFFSTTTYAQSYLSLGYGIANTSSDSSYLEDVDGNTIALAYGKHSSQRFAWEAVFRKTSFDKSTDSFSFPGFGTFNVTSEVDVMSFGGGFRYFLGRFLNINAGLLYSKTDFNIETNLGGDAIADDDSGLGLYYGFGIQLPLGPIEIIADYTGHKFSSDVSATEITGGVRLRF